MSATSGVLFSSTSTWACPSTRRIRDGALGVSNSVFSVSAPGGDGLDSSSSLFLSSSKWTRRFWFRVITVASALAFAESVTASA
ncbi:hypothetical protein PF005_g25875 [Phytophthora fragariae]|uniref:Uncharacterized protein n=1 Tax=Phytophthora fragariae TaxID=53985 RepID=A0A6A3DWE9_9STRA|nr:hypothetical protein PF009_g26158 [Phytophthora fragariae]KAE8997820.1 hypothetical protein PF011_g15310 [Phytophthora fragariae]KAE9059540.1 hypothetical protein PF010_g30577 [Phytophthora fragariae]KAE9066218.1 hypothetical protein PF006_g30292 [Phytophthora fragariae]KAE9074474.1 hypothetical protein PF007_g25398 [Phytophthora fragariae]